MSCTRREFLAGCSGLGATCCAAAIAAPPVAARPGGDASESEDRSNAGALKAARARYWEAHDDGTVQCKLEPRQCHVAPGERGFCGVRENRDGAYYSLVHSRPCVTEILPIENDFYHVLPGLPTLMVGTAGCNLRCTFCNTYQISQTRPEALPFEDVTPQQLVESALEKKCKAINFTYNDPVVCIEYILDVYELAKKHGLRTMCHTAAMIHPEPLKDLAAAMDAINIDLKAFSEKVYQAYCSVPLAPVLAAIRQLASAPDTFLEITTPILPRINDTATAIRTLSKWIADNAGADTPWQLARYLPSYRLAKTTSVTSFRTMVAARALAKKTGMRHVYLRNTASDVNQNVVCPECGETAVDRSEDQPQVAPRLHSNGACGKCKHEIPGVWS